VSPLHQSKSNFGREKRGNKQKKRNPVYTYQTRRKHAQKKNGLQLVNQRGPQIQHPNLTKEVEELAKCLRETSRPKRDRPVERKSRKSGDFNKQGPDQMKGTNEGVRQSKKKLNSTSSQRRIGQTGTGKEGGSNKKRQNCLGGWVLSSVKQQGSYNRRGKAQTCRGAADDHSRGEKQGTR